MWHTAARRPAEHIYPRKHNPSLPGLFSQYMYQSHKSQLTICIDLNHLIIFIVACRQSKPPTNRPMDCAYRNATTTRVLNTFFRPRQLRIQQQHLLHRHQLASYPRTQTRSYASPSPPDPKKPIVLEQPDKFRPPSHGARRNARSSTNTYGAGAYNQNMTAAQLESSKTKSYPHMFPPEGSRMYWSLTTRWVHVVFTFVRTTSSSPIVPETTNMTAFPF